MSDEMAAHPDYRARVPHSLHAAPFLPATSSFYSTWTQSHSDQSVQILLSPY